MTEPVRRWLHYKGFTTWTEGIIGSGRYADIIGVQLDEERCRRRLEEGPLTYWGKPEDCNQRLLRDLPDWYPLFDRVVAVELKLDRVSDAISQAHSYYAQCPETYVGLPNAVACRWVGKWDTEARAIYRDALPGLLAVRPAEVEVLISPLPSMHVPAADIVNIAEIAWRYWRKHESKLEGSTTV